MPDQHKNFSYSTVQAGSGVISSTTGTSVILATGDGANFPTPPFNIVVWPSSAQPLSSNAEIMRCTAISTDTLTVTRAQENTTALSGIAAGYQVDAAHTMLMQQIAERYPGTFFEFDTDFAMAGSYWTSAASGASQAAAAGSSGRPGALQLSSGTTAGGLGIVGLGLASSAQPIHLNDNWEVEWIFQTAPTITDTDIAAGISNSTSASPSDLCWIEKLAADTHFFLKTVHASTADTRQDTGTVVAASTWYSILVGKLNTQVYYSINRAAPTFYTPTNMPQNGVSSPMLRIAVSGTASSRTITIDYGRMQITGLSR